MILFTNGCSWTYGGGLGLDHKSEEQRLSSVWPYHLGKLLNSEKTVNLAFGGTGNSRILRTTFDWIQEQTIEDLANTTAIIQWSDPSRYEYYVPDGKLSNYEHDPNRWASSKSRLETYTDVEGMYKHIAECGALGFLFKTYNIRYYYWNYYTLVHTYPQKIKEYLLSNHKWLDDGLSNWNYERIGPHDAHPGLLGHKQLAQIIFKKMKEKE